MNTNRFFHFGVLASLGLTAAACSDSSTKSGTTKGTTGGTSATTTAGTTAGATGGTSTTTGFTTGGTTSATTGGATGGGTAGGTAGYIVPDATGWVDKTATGTYMIQGAFYQYGDSLGPNGQPPGDCQGAGFATAMCSSVTLTMPITNGTVCISGSGAVVPTCGATAMGKCTTPAMPAYSAVWGAGVGFDLNNSGGDAAVKSPYNAQAMGITGVGFDLTGVPTGGIRIEFPAQGQGDNARYITESFDGSYEAKFADSTVAYDPVTYPGAADATQIFSFQWHVPTSTTAAVAFTNLCVSNIHLLTN